MSRHFLSISIAFGLIIGLIFFQSCKDEDDTPSGPRTEIWVSDAANFEKAPWQIIRYDENGENPKVFTNKNVSWPQDILFLEDQKVVLVTNAITGNIARFDIETGDFLGNFATGMGLPNRMKIRDGLLYVLQWTGSEKVRRYELNGTLVDEFTKTGVYQAIGMDWDSEGNLYVASFNDGANGYVRKFDTNGNDLGIFIDKALQGPTNIWFDASGNLMINDWQGGFIKQFDASGNFVKNVVSGLSQVEGVAFLENGNILIGNGGSGAIKMYDPDFKFIKDLVKSKAGGLIRPNAVAVRKVE